MAVIQGCHKMVFLILFVTKGTKYLTSLLFTW